MSVLNSIGDLREVARRRVPRALFDYLDRGSYDELTLRRNRADLEAVRLRQRVMVDVSSIATATTLAGQPCSMPLAIAPTGLTGLFHRDGEICGARAAAAAGIPFCLSTLSIGSIEDARAASGAPFWFQLYLMRDRGFNEELIGRARAAQCPVLVLTLDLQVQGERRRDAKNGLAVPPRLTLRNALDIAARPAWALGMLRAKRRNFGNIVGHLPDSQGARNVSVWISGQFDPSVNWQDVAWVRSLWPGKLVLKGVLDPDDARRAADAGADAVVVSNHGGRQLDGAPSTIAALPSVVDALRGRCEVLFDGGVMGGQDILKALAHGARGCLIGKAFLYGLAAGGEAGVARALSVLRGELEVSMALTGATDAQKVDGSLLWDR
ncbi:MAG: alpha-hydroxy-acid oxidizing protein [Gammaproteobacteria bacterium]|nr:alpha-hydroxy-acid oxidizing protein [Gammaproteobacteria bacterium]